MTALLVSSLSFLTGIVLVRGWLAGRAWTSSGCICRRHGWVPWCPVHGTEDQ